MLFRRPSAAAAAAAMLVVFVCAPTVRADLLVPDSFRDRIMRFSSTDGSLIDMNFITNESTGNLFQLAIEAAPVGDQIWVSDQNADSIFRFTQTGQFLGTVVGPSNGLDNIRGFGVVNNILYVTNFFDGNGAPGPAIRRFNATTGADLGSAFPPGVTSPWDVIEFDNSVIVSDGGTITGSNTGFLFRLDRNTGEYTSTFASGQASTNGLTLPKGLTTLDNGNLLVANNSTPRNLYEYDASGNRVATYSMGDLSVNGVFELDNGRIFVAAQGTGVFGTNGLYSLDRATGELTPILLGSQTSDGFIPNFVNFAVVPEPAAASLVLTSLLVLARRRRRAGW